jgi:hypothetical protein
MFSLRSHFQIHWSFRLASDMEFALCCTPFSGVSFYTFTPLKSVQTINAGRSSKSNAVVNSSATRVALVNAGSENIGENVEKTSEW